MQRKHGFLAEDAGLALVDGVAIALMQETTTCRCDPLGRLIEKTDPNAGLTSCQ